MSNHFNLIKIFFIMISMLNIGNSSCIVMQRESYKHIFLRGSFMNPSKKYTENESNYPSEIIVTNDILSLANSKFSLDYQAGILCLGYELYKFLENRNELSYFNRIYDEFRANLECNREKGKKYVDEFFNGNKIEVSYNLSEIWGVIFKKKFANIKTLEWYNTMTLPVKRRTIYNINKFKNSKNLLEFLAASMCKRNIMDIFHLIPKSSFNPEIVKLVKSDLYKSMICRFKETLIEHFRDLYAEFGYNTFAPKYIAKAVTILLKKGGVFGIDISYIRAFINGETEEVKRKIISLLYAFRETLPSIFPNGYLIRTFIVEQAESIADAFVSKITYNKCKLQEKYLLHLAIQSASIKLYNFTWEEIAAVRKELIKGNSSKILLNSDCNRGYDILKCISNVITFRPDLFDLKKDEEKFAIINTIFSKFENINTKLNDKFYCEN